MSSVIVEPQSLIQSSTNASIKHDGPLSQYELHNYRPSLHLSDDVNYMDIVMIITRSSILRQGSMGCLLVQPNHNPQFQKNHNEMNAVDHKDVIYTKQKDSDHANRIFEGIIAAANNSSLFQADDSDVHAEINAIGQVAKMSRLPQNNFQLSNNKTTITMSHATKNTVSTQGATAYITMPPCKKCFGALYASGITRIVSRRQASTTLLETSAKNGIEMVCLTDKEMAEQKVRLDALFLNVGPNNNLDATSEATNSTVPSADEILKRRKQRKEEQRAKKKSKANNGNVAK